MKFFTGDSDSQKPEGYYSNGRSATDAIYTLELDLEMFVASIACDMWIGFIIKSYQDESKYVQIECDYFENGLWGFIDKEKGLIENKDK